MWTTSARRAVGPGPVCQHVAMTAGSRDGRALPLPVGASARRAERGIALTAAAIRSVVVVQIGLGAASGVGLSRNPAAYALLSALVIAVSATVVVQCLLTGTVRSGVWRYPDLLLGFVAVPALHVLVPAPQLMGTWEAWAVGYAINTAAIAATWLRPSAAVTYAIALSAWSSTFTLIADTGAWRSTLTNALTIPGYAVVVALLARYLRRLAADADSSREEAIAATRALELQRYQLTVHDATSILRLLSDERTPAEVLPGLRVQADREARRLRNYLDPRTRPAADSLPLTLGTMLGTALEGFDDLPLELAIELGADAALDPRVWAVARGAVTTVLHNVRLHAAAHQVVVHADTDGTRWEIVISDDGVGFDQNRQLLGFGLNTQVRQALSDCGASVRIHSTPGRGTSVTVVGPVSGQEGRQ